MFTYGDIVRPIFGRNGVEYFIVTDVFDFSKNKDGSDLEYEITRIFPVDRALLVATASEKKIEIQAKHNSKEAKMILDFIKKEQVKRGGEYLDFMKVIEKNKKGAVLIQLDVIRYDMIDTVDECLDALNHLTDLHQAFGDEAFLQLKEVVTSRLKVLLK